MKGFLVYLLTTFQVQTKVRQLCVNRNFESGGQLVVVWDTLTHMTHSYEKTLPVS